MEPVTNAALMDEHLRLISAFRRIARGLDVQSRLSDREAGLTLPQMLVLGRIRDGAMPEDDGWSDRTGRAIARSIALSAPTVVGIMDKLESKGLIERRRSSSDRRNQQARLTEKGAQALDAMPSPLGQLFVGQFDNMPTQQRAALIESVETLAGMMSAPLR